MAKVEKVEQEVAPPKWEPFVTITLSKREAAGVAALLACSSVSLVGYSVWEALVRELDPSHDYGRGMAITGSNDEAQALDDKFGKL